MATAFRFFHLFFLLAIAHAPAIAQPREQTLPDRPISEVQVILNPVPGSGPDLSALAKAMIDIRTPTSFSPEKIQKAIAYFTQSGRFEKIHVDSEESPKGIVLIFHLTPYPLIYDIQFTGTFPLFEKTVSAAMTVSAGSPFRATEIEQQRNSIEALYRREGFLSPRVSVETRTEGKWAYVKVVFRIKPGRYYRLKQLDIVGNQVIPNERLKLKLATWRMRLLPGSSGRFSETELKNDLTRLTRFYRDLGYDEIRIDHTLSKNLDTGDVSARIDISEGPRYQVQFSGNNAISQRRLQKELKQNTDGSAPSEIEIRKRLNQIKKLYQDRGFSDVKVKRLAHPSQNASQDERRIAVSIDEGPQTRVNSVCVRGNQYFDENRILSVMHTHTPDILKKGYYRSETLSEDLQSIKDIYLSQGFLSPDVNTQLQFNLDRTAVDIIVNITENQRVIVSETQIVGEIPIPQELAASMLALTPGSPYRPYMLRSDENKLAERIAEEGYPHARVTGLAEVSDRGDRASIRYQVDTGPFVRMGNVWYRGNFRTREKTLDRALGLEPGEPFSMKKLLNAERGIREMDIFDSVRFDTLGLLDKNDHIDLLVEMEEAPPYFIEIGVGYESSEGFLTHNKVGDHNILGRNRSGWLGMEYSQVTHRFEGSITDPKLLDTPFQSNLSAFWEQTEAFNQIFGTEVTGASLSLKAKAIRDLTLGVKTQYEFRNLYMRNGNGSSTEIDSDALEYRHLWVTSPTLQYDTRDSFIRPKKGILSSIGCDISKGIEDTLDDFTRYRFDARYFWSPMPSVTFAWLGQTGILIPFGDNDMIPIDQLFYLGGTNNVRGFDENALLLDIDGEALGGRGFVSGSIETRWDLSEHYELAFFLDAGRISDTQGAKVETDFRFSAGIGLRYLTPIGPIGILHGWKLDPKPGESPGQFHFSIGYTF